MLRLGLIFKPVKCMLAILLLSMPCLLSAQFYNGHQMNFGKNRVQYTEFEWLYYRYKQFDTYFYLGGNENALQVAYMANKAIPEIERFFDHKIEQRLIFVIYNRLSDFRQSNIGLNTGDEAYNIGGVTRIVDNIVFLYVEADRKQLEKQVRAAIAEVVLNEMLYGVGLTNKIANNTLIALPDWFFYGLISYCSERWNYEIDNRVRDGILSGRFEQFNHLTGDEALYAGHSIWYYVASTYGEQVISTIIYLTRVTKNVENGFQYVLGSGLKMLSYDWLGYFENLYKPHEQTTVNAAGTNIVQGRHRNWQTQQAVVSNNGTKVAYAIKNLGKYKIYIYDINRNKRKKLLVAEHKLEQIVDYSYPVLSWHPSGKLLGYVIEKHGKIFYCAYNLETRQTQEREIAGVSKVLSIDYSGDGLKLLMAGHVNGMSDIFVFNILANTLMNLTADIADDYNPRYINNSKQIIFCSNRATDTLLTGKDFDIATQQFRDVFVMDAEGKNNILLRVTNTPHTDETLPMGGQKNEFYYLSNENGVVNRYKANFDSAISYIDTITHYRYFTRSAAQTNYNRNIAYFDAARNADIAAEVLFLNKRWHIMLNDYRNVGTEKNNNNTRFRKVQLESLNQKIPEKPKFDVVEPIEPESDRVDINNYVFSTEALKQKDIEVSEFDSLGFPYEKRRNKYFTTFYTNYVVNQIDFGFLSSSYQPFTGSAFYFNPGFNILFKLGAKDLFEDYRITGGVRFSGNFDSNEYLISFEDLKRRWNRQYVFHRLVLNTSDGYNLMKSHTHELMYITRYPFNQVSAMQFTLSTRTDRQTLLSLDYTSLTSTPQYNYWLGGKGEYIFDNTRQKQLNIYYGSRFKFFGEYYRQIDRKQSDLVVFGGDFRYYLPIHRNLIVAARVAASGSFGRSKLIYYLGGIDNWINFSSNTPTFDNTVRIDPDANYVYQAVATNMRGFSQNIRNGSNFAVVNAELRWPVVSYILNRPLNSAFLENLQLIGFFDLGSAWSGWDPFSGDNAFDKDVYNQYPVTVIIDNNNYPIVAGYGFGIRSKLFGYFVRADWAWGIENNTLLPGVFYLSLNLDF